MEKPPHTEEKSFNQKERRECRLHSSKERNRVYVFLLMVHSEAEELAKEIRTAAQHLDPIGGANREVEIFSSPRRPEGGHEEIEIFTPRNNPKSPYRRSPFYAVRTLDSIHREHEGTVSLSPGSPGGGIVSYSIAGHLLNEITPEQAAALIRQQLAAISRQRRSGRSHQ